MKLLDFNVLTGFPMSASSFKFIQEQMLQLQMLSLLGGTNFIVSGCTNLGSTIDVGWVVIAGEILPFAGGTPKDHVVVVDTVTNRSFSGGAVNPYYHNRVVQFTDDITATLWSSFEVNDPNDGVLKRLRLAETLLGTLQTSITGINTALGTKANRSDVLIKGGSTSFTPSLDTDPATKGYVDNKLLILAKGTTRAQVNGNSAGDIDGWGEQVILIGETFPDSIGTNYNVFLTLINKNTHDARATWYLKDKTTSSFTIVIAELASGNVQDIYFDWMIISN